MVIGAGEDRDPYDAEGEDGAEVGEPVDGEVEDEAPVVDPLLRGADRLQLGVALHGLDLGRTVEREGLGVDAHGNVFEALWSVTQ